MLLILVGQCQAKHIERNLSFDGIWTCSVLPDHWSALCQQTPTYSVCLIRLLMMAMSKVHVIGVGLQLRVIRVGGGGWMECVDQASAHE